MEETFFVVCRKDGMEYAGEVTRPYSEVRRLRIFVTAAAAKEYAQRMALGCAGREPYVVFKSIAAYRVLPGEVVEL